MLYALSIFYIHITIYKACKNQTVVKNLRIVAQQWTSSEGHLLRLYFGDYNDLNIYSDYRGRDLDLDLV